MLKKYRLRLKIKAKYKEGKRVKYIMKSRLCKMKSKNSRPPNLDG